MVSNFLWLQKNHDSLLMKLQIFKFLVVGGFSALVNILSRAVFGWFVGYFISIVMAFFVALTTAFCLNKFWVFEKSKYKNFWIEYFFFLLVNLFGLLQTIVISYLLKDYLFPMVDFSFHNETVAHAIGVMIPVFTSYLGHKYLSFRKATVNVDEIVS